MLVGAAVGPSGRRLYFFLRSSHPPSNNTIPSSSYLKFLQAGYLLLIFLTPPRFFIFRNMFRRIDVVERVRVEQKKIAIGLVQKKL